MRCVLAARYRRLEAPATIAYGLPPLGKFRVGRGAKPTVLLRFAVPVATGVAIW